MQMLVEIDDCEVDEATRQKLALIQQEIIRVRHVKERQLEIINRIHQQVFGGKN